MRNADAQISHFIPITTLISVFEKVWQTATKLAKLSQKEQRDTPHQTSGGEFPGNASAFLSQNHFGALKPFSGLAPTAFQKSRHPGCQYREADGMRVVDALCERLCRPQDFLRVFPVAPPGKGVVSGFESKSASDLISLPGLQRQKQMAGLVLRRTHRVNHAKATRD